MANAQLGISILLVLCASIQCTADSIQQPAQLLLEAQLSHVRLQQFEWFDWYGPWYPTPDAFPNETEAPTPNKPTTTHSGAGSNKTDNDTTKTKNSNTTANPDVNKGGGGTKSDKSATISTGDNGLSVVAILAIVIGAVAAVVLAIAAVLYNQKIKAQQREANMFADLGDHGAASDTNYAAM